MTWTSLTLDETQDANDAESDAEELDLEYLPMLFGSSEGFEEAESIDDVLRILGHQRKSYQQLIEHYVSKFGDLQNFMSNL